MSKVLSDMPFSLVLPNLASIPIYLMTGQYLEQMWRLFNYAFIYILITLNSSAIGFLLGALLSDYPTAIAFLGVLSFFPLIILSGNHQEQHQAWPMAEIAKTLLSVIEKFGEPPPL